MAGGTHVFDMIKRLSENENLRKKNYFKKARTSYKRISNSINLDYPIATKEDRQKIRNQIIFERRKQTTKSILVLLFSIVVTAILVLLVVRYASYL